MDDTTAIGNGGLVGDSGNSFNVSNNCGSLKVMPDFSAEANEIAVKEITIDGPEKESEGQEDNHSTNSESGDVEMRTANDLSSNRLPNEEFTLRTNISNNHSGHDNFRAVKLPLSGNFQVDKVSSSTDLVNNGSVDHLSASKNEDSPHSLLSDLEKLNGWFWMPFSELRQIYMKDLQRIYVPKFECVGSYTPEHLPDVYQLISEEGARLHIPLGTGNCMVSDYESEFSSIIACALALLKEIPVSTAVFNEDCGRDSEMAVKTIDSLRSLSGIPTISSPFWSVSGSLVSDSIYSVLENACFLSIF